MPSLRPYQIAACDSAMEHLTQDEASGSGTLLVLATGLGKTFLATEIMRRFLALRHPTHPKERILFLTHRTELRRQTEAAIETMLGFPPDVEQAESRDQRTSSVLCASVQTLSQPRRLQRHPADEFGLIVFDEVHHFQAEGTWARIGNHFAGARRIGLTATAKRSDGKKLGAEWESVAFEYGIRDAIRDGWLSPVRRRLARVDGLRLDGVATRGGDFVQSELEEATLRDEATVQSWALGIKAVGNRKVLAFCPGVESSRRLAEVLNRDAPPDAPLAIHLDGETEDYERSTALRDFKHGRYQYLMNCGLFGEGFDEPSIDCVALCRPSKSHPWVAQAIGRGTRTIADLNACATAEERVAAIAASAKPDLLVLEFTSATTRFDVVTAIDILSDGESEDVIALAEEEQRANPALDIEACIAKAQKRQQAKEEQSLREAQRRAEEAARRNIHATGKVSFFDVDTVVAVDKMLGINEYAVAHRARRFGAKPITDKQRAMLEKNGFAVDDTSDDGLALARARLDKIFARMNGHLCSVKQARVLMKNGFPTEVSFDKAREIMDTLAANRWRLTPAQRDALMGGTAPGDDESVPF